MNGTREGTTDNLDDAFSAAAAGFPEDLAGEYARWFRCLADGTRIRILNLVATAEEPTTVGKIVEAIGKSQSTVSRHLQILAEERFVFMEPDGIRTLVRINHTCMTALPEAAAAIMATPNARRQS